MDTRKFNVRVPINVYVIISLEAFRITCSIIYRDNSDAGQIVLGGMRTNRRHGFIKIVYIGCSASTES